MANKKIKCKCGVLVTKGYEAVHKARHKNHRKEEDVLENLQKKTVPYNGMQVIVITLGDGTHHGFIRNGKGLEKVDVTVIEI